MPKKKKDDYQKLGSCAVDSGLIVLVDPCYAMNHGEDSDDQKTYDDLVNELNAQGEVRTMPFVFSGVAGTGVVIDTPEGDGVYPVYGLFRDGKLAEVKIVFDDEPCGDEDEVRVTYGSVDGMALGGGGGPSTPGGSGGRVSTPFGVVNASEDEGF